MIESLDDIDRAAGRARRRPGLVGRRLRGRSRQPALRRGAGGHRRRGPALDGAGPGRLPAAPGARCSSAHGLRSAGGFVFERAARPGCARAPRCGGPRRARRDRGDRRPLPGGDRPAGRSARGDRRALGGGGAARRRGAGGGSRPRCARSPSWRRNAACARSSIRTPAATSSSRTRSSGCSPTCRRDVLGLCLDTGHALYAGADPAALVARHADRLEHLHLKDVSAPRLAAARADRLDFWAAIAGGIFCPVGDGSLDARSACARRSRPPGSRASRRSSRTAAPARRAARPATSGAASSGSARPGSARSRARPVALRRRARSVEALEPLASGQVGLRERACRLRVAASGTPRSQNAPVSSSGRPGIVGQWITVVTSPSRASASAAASASASSARRPRQPKLPALAA